MLAHIKLGFALLILSGILANCIQGDKVIRNQLPIESTGDCALPQIIGQSTDFALRGGEEICVLYTAPESFKGLSNGCLVSKYNLAGHKTSHKFVVGERWHVFPLWRDLEACALVFTRKEWKLLMERVRPTPVQQEFLLSKSSTIDVSTDKEDQYRLLYTANPTDEVELRSFLLQAMNEGVARASLYARNNGVQIEVYSFERRLQSGGYPLCEAKLSPANKITDELPKLKCDEQQIKIWRDRDKIVFGMPPEFRRRIFEQIAYLSRPYTKKSYETPSASQREIHWIYLRSGMERIDAGVLRHTLKELKIGRSELAYILDEGYTLGWAFSMVDRTSATNR